jgi:hypothetical protein
MPLSPALRLLPQRAVLDPDIGGGTMHLDPTWEELFMTRERGAR